MTCETVILAAGDFPRKNTAARRILDSALRVICCDGAADTYRRRTGRQPTAVVGDCDSVKGRFGRVVRIAEQETNDLEKAIGHCAARGWKRPVILGATGGRDDHALGNVFRAMEHGLEIVTDYGRFVPIVGKQSLRVGKGAPVSVFAMPGTRMESSGLKWPLGEVRFENFHCATLNRSDAAVVRLTASRPAYAFIAEGNEET